METFNDRDLTAAEFRESVLDRVRMVGVVMRDAVIDGEVINLVINGIEVSGYVEAELDKRYPERPLLRSAEPAELREGWRLLQEDWAATIARVRAMPEGTERTRVNDEWSTIETLRHLIFAVDAWFRRGALGVESPYTPLSIAGPWLADDELPTVQAALDATADPTFDEVLAVRAERVAEIGAGLDSTDAAALAAPRPPLETEGWPPHQEDYTVVDALHVALKEEWWHHRFTVRDLDALEAGAAS
ncbi:MAG: DinB family protein [Nocardioides sp.]